ncbi:alpha/beta hydrolase [uncultured Chryseobacterium sp.]|uniref:alpha/beta fold hydrolase n=1 Tax=uncultured Chryseobacterium sp. TaxID=259322 RepID=UPI0025FD3209|nr:alpha/beta hydrolase [uncultured Chryseobacterium sp.]
MKKIISLFFLFFYFVVFSQNKIVVSTWTSMMQPIQVENMQNRQFRLSAKIRQENGNEAKCAIWARVDNTDNKVGFFENQAYSEIKVTPEWNSFEIKGTVSPEGKTLNIGAFAEGNGDFYFDDFKLEVLDPKMAKWINIPLKNSGFEEDLDAGKNWVEGIGRNKITHAKNFSISTSGNKPFSGKKSLLIKARNIIGNMPHGKFADVNGIKVYYETYGEGEPLLMLHGNGQSISAFMNQVDDFSKKYKVIIVDCRERGKSTYDKTKELTFDIQVEDLKQFLDQQNIKKVKILGWSDGGILAILMALKYPDLVDKIACSGANIFPEGVTDEELKDSKETLARLIKENKNGKNDVYIDLYNLDLKYPNLKYEDLKAIQCPSLIIAGDKDVIKTEHTVKISESIPKGQLAIVPNSTHSVVVEKPELFNSLVMDFFEGK